MELGSYPHRIDSWMELEKSCREIDSRNKKGYFQRNVAFTFMATSSILSDNCEWEIGWPSHRTLFSVKRREHLNAVKSLMAMDEKKQEKLLLELVFNIIKVMGNAKNIVEKANFKPNDTFPSEEQSSLRDAIGNIVENTAFYSNLVLYFPTILLDRYKKDIDWQLLFAWAYKFTTTSRLHDDAAEKLLDLVGQQLEIIPRRDDFHNPYDRKAIKEELQREALRKMEEALREKQEQKKLDRKKKKKKPSLSRNEL
uniref:Coiled-coil domain-containing protein n=1 Tax=Loa loa TaxID=7209 RepID=A0A1I7VU31_LOALO